MKVYFIASDSGGPVLNRDGGFNVKYRAARVAYSAVGLTVLSANEKGFRSHPHLGPRTRARDRKSGLANTAADSAPPPPAKYLPGNHATFRYCEFRRVFAAVSSTLITFSRSRRTRGRASVNKSKCLGARFFETVTRPLATRTRLLSSASELFSNDKLHAEGWRDVHKREHARPPIGPRPSRGVQIADSVSPVVTEVGI